MYSTSFHRQDPPSKTRPLVLFYPPIVKKKFLENFSELSMFAKWTTINFLPFKDVILISSVIGLISWEL